MVFTTDRLRPYGRTSTCTACQCQVTTWGNQEGPGQCPQCGDTLPSRREQQKGNSKGNYASAPWKHQGDDKWEKAASKRKQGNNRKKQPYLVCKQCNRWQYTEKCGLQCEGCSAFYDVAEVFPKLAQQQAPTAGPVKAAWAPPADSAQGATAASADDKEKGKGKGTADITADISQMEADLAVVVRALGKECDGAAELQKRIDNAKESRIE